MFGGSRSNIAKMIQECKLTRVYCIFIAAEPLPGCVSNANTNNRNISRPPRRLTFIPRRVCGDTMPWLVCTFRRNKREIQCSLSLNCFSSNAWLQLLQILTFNLLRSIAASMHSRDAALRCILGNAVSFCFCFCCI